MKILINNLNKEFDKKKIINNSSLELPDIGLVAFVGDNGCGKTTLFNIISLLDDDFSGNILFDNKNIKEFSAKEKNDILRDKISVLFQNENLISYLNINDNVNLFNYINNDRYITVSFFDGKRIKNLSSGEKVLLCLERFLNSDKQVLILDEFTDYLNIKIIDKIMPKIIEISKKKLVIFSSHNQHLIDQAEIIYEFKNNEIILKKGIISEAKLPSNLFEYNSKRMKHKKVFPKFCFGVLKQNIFLTILIIIINCFATICSFGFTTEYTQNNELIDKDYLNKNIGNSCTIKRFQNEELFKFDNFQDLQVLSSNTICEKEKIKIKNSNKFGSFLMLDSATNPTLSLIFDDVAADKIFVPKYLQDSFEYVGDKIKIEYSDGVYVLSDYEIDDSTEKIKATLSTDHLKKLLFTDGLPVRLSMRNNENFSLNNSFDVRKLFDNKQINRFISKTSLEYRENKTIDYKIDDNVFYIDDSLNYYYTNEKINFFDFEDVNMQGDENNYVNFNDDFEDIKLIKNNVISQYLCDKEILVSDVTFEQIRSHYFSNINLKYVSKKATNNDFVKFLNTNKYVFYDNYGHYSSKIFVKLPPILQQLFITLILITLLIIIIINYLLIYVLFHKNEVNNKILISCGVSINKAIKITLFPYCLINFAMFVSYLLFYFLNIQRDFSSHNYNSLVFTYRNLILLFIYILTQIIYLYFYYKRYKKGNFKV